MANKGYKIPCLCLAAAAGLAAQTFTTLHTFNGTDGEFPDTALVQGLDGNLYGGTRWAGANAAYPLGGTIFRITTGGTLTTVHNFCTTNGTCVAGTGPNSLIAGADGNIYGTGSGGTNNCDSAYGCGTLFSITPGGKLTTLYEFCPAASTGCGDVPVALAQAFNGDFYGVTFWGGTTCTGTGCGTVFKIAPNGTENTLYNFCSQMASNGICTDGETPYGLVQGADGNFYGTTESGGSYTGPYGFGGGTVFKMTPSGVLTVLHSFCGKELSGVCVDGSYPVAGLVQAANGDFYGTTWGGVTQPGTVFRITPSGNFQTLHAFCSASNCSDGKQPLTGLVQASDGNFYGTTEAGGAYAGGTLFKVTPAGTFTTLYSFCSQANCADGYGPSAGLAQATDGNLYGTTAYGGANTNCTDVVGGTCGTVFRLSVGLGPLVKALPRYGKIGSSIRILGTNLTGASGVTFNGIAATFQVVSATEMTATVPRGATSGPVQVTTPGGVLATVGPFMVLP